MKVSRSEKPESLASAWPSGPRLLLHLEGATLLAAAATLFFASNGGWLFFLLLFLAPDLSILGYLLSPRVGAAVYNAFHSYPLPALLIVAAYLTGQPVLLHVAFVWLAHIGTDRAFGYGLKYGTSFKTTHLQKV